MFFEEIKVIGAKEIIDFWFEEINPENWFNSSEEFDQDLHKKYFKLHQQIAQGEAYKWRKTPQGRLAEILVLDQFSRQFFRGEAKAFATDAMALTLAQELVSLRGDSELSEQQRMFAYMPYMHSESLIIHDEAVRLYKGLGNKNTLEFEISHRDIIVEFGRFPKRNNALGRKSTKEEIVYIAGRDGHHF